MLIKRVLNYLVLIIAFSFFSEGWHFYQTKHYKNYICEIEAPHPLYDPAFPALDGTILESGLWVHLFRTVGLDAHQMIYFWIMLACIGVIGLFLYWQKKYFGYLMLLLFTVLSLLRLEVYLVLSLLLLFLLLLPAQRKQ